MDQKNQNENYRVIYKKLKQKEQLEKRKENYVLLSM
ncbi:unnamed protein product, partial [marine sediment metagenome]